MRKRVVPVSMVAPDPAIVEEAGLVLRRGGVIAYPTETLYGLGADAMNREAVARVRAVKGRSDGKPILLLADSAERVRSFVGDLSGEVRRVMEACWPGALTLVLPAGPEVPGEVTAGSGTVGVRVPDHPLCRALVAELGQPITSTSANRSGEPTPSTPAELVRVFGSAVDLYLDGGMLAPSPGSTVVDMTVAPARVLRVGAFPVQRLGELLPGLVV
jgi:L-threonylcarbamoyladenylate synthase